MEQRQAIFTQLYDRFIAKIYRFVYLKVSSGEIAEDLTSEVFVRLWEVLDRTDITNIQAYLYQIARSVIAEHYRTRTKKATLSLEVIKVVIDPSSSPKEEAEVKLEMDRVKEALASLKDDYQDFIIWRYLDELSVPEIAQITGKSDKQ